MEKPMDRELVSTFIHAYSLDRHLPPQLLEGIRVTKRMSIIAGGIVT